MAELHALFIIYGMVLPSAGYAKAKEEIRKVRELGGESHEVWGVEALLALVYDWDTPAALGVFGRALELDPSYVPGRAWYTWALTACGRKGEAVEQALRMQATDPMSPYANAMAGCACLLADRVDQAYRYTRKALEIEGDSLLATWMCGLATAASANWGDAIRLFNRAVEHSNKGPFFVGLLAWAQAASGRREQARQTLAELQDRSASEYVPPLYLALAYSELGEAEKTRELLQEAFAQRTCLLVLETLPVFRRLQDEPLMVDLCRRLESGMTSGCGMDAQEASHGGRDFDRGDPTGTRP